MIVDKERILVTDAAGLVGSHVDDLLECGMANEIISHFSQNYILVLKGHHLLSFRIMIYISWTILLRSVEILCESD